MNKINEYRKASAEWLGLHTGWSYVTNDKYFDKNEKFICRRDEWYPNIDANQQRMIENELIKRGFSFVFEYHAYGNNWLIILTNANYDVYHQVDKSGSTAFRLAWMKFYKTLKNNERTSRTITK